MDDRIDVYDKDGNKYSMLPVDAREAIRTGHYTYALVEGGVESELEPAMRAEGVVVSAEGPTNDELRKILTDRGVTYAANTSRVKLLQLVADSEPKE